MLLEIKFFLKLMCIAAYSVGVFFILWETKEFVKKETAIEIRQRDMSELKDKKIEKKLKLVDDI
jgi:hypothetical protein